LGDGRAGVRRGRRAAALYAALPLRADARLPHAVPRDRCDEPPHGTARRRRDPAARPRRPQRRAVPRADGVVPLANHPALEAADLSSLRKAYYGASIMPVPVRERLQQRLPDLGFYNCFGQSEIGPLATVLLPAEHTQRPSSCGRTVLFVEARV